MMTAAQRACEEQPVRQSLSDISGVDMSSMRAWQSPDPAGPPCAVQQNLQPHQVLEMLESATKWQDRCRVLEDFHKSLLCIEVKESRPHMSEVLLILNRLLTDTNFKITLTTLYIIGDLVDHWSSSMMAVVGAVVPGLVEKLGDNKIVIRQTATKIFHKIFTAVVRMRSPQYAEKLLQSLTSSLAQRSAHLRLELLSVTIMALLVFENGGVPYDHEQILQVMCQSAQDSNERVSAVAMEALAVLQSAGGDIEERIAVLLHDDQATLTAVVTRWDRGTLPTVNDEGLVEYPSRSALPEQPELMMSAQSPTSALRLPNAAMAVGRLGRKMFCLEDPSPSANSPMPPGSRGQSSNSSRRVAGPQTSAGIRRPGSCSDAEGMRNQRSPPTSAMKDRRRVAVQPLRVYFKDDLNDFMEEPGTPSIAGSAHKEGCHSPWAIGPHDCDLPGSPTAKPAVCEESPNYIPNWKRPVTRQARNEGRTQQPRVRPIETECDSPAPPMWIARRHQLSLVSEESLEQKAGGSADRVAQSEPLSPLLGDCEEAELARDIATPSRAVGASRVGGRRLFGGQHPGCVTRSASAGATTSEFRPMRKFHEELPPSPSMIMHSRRMSAQLQLESVPSDPLAEAQPELQANCSEGNPRSALRRSRGSAGSVAGSASGHTGLMSPSDGAVHCLSSDELPPFEAAPSERWLDDLFRRLKTPSDWVAQVEALTDLRRLARYAPQLLGAAHPLRQAVACVIGQVESLRSSVAKGALMCLHDLFLTYKWGMDAELDVVAPVCLRKAADNNGSISDEAERTLLAMCQSTSEAKGLAMLLAFAVDGRSKNAKLRAKSVWCLIIVIQRLGPRIFRIGDVDRLVQLLHKLLGDASSEVRNLAKLATTALHSVAASAEEFDRLLGRCLTNADVLKVKQMLLSVPAPERQKAESGTDSASRQRLREDCRGPTALT
mmetsp:Transcript_21287/g.54299  ORF Transcript_21287/g.54299 Transcript_21287/m.54299 type:complete len:944 (-) Transcript_21287:28-2859(-)